MPLGTKVGLGPDHIVLDGDRAPPKGSQPASNFWPVFIVTEGSLISAVGWAESAAGGLDCEKLTHFCLWVAITP